MIFSRFDHECMTLALRLAAQGVNTCHPNPRVGCVIAENGKIIASGWHAIAGGPHAETLALNSAGSAARGATAYVTLEPCSHHGRTPPCVKALLASGVARVVIAMLDPDPRVNGEGQRALEAAGIKVECGLMAEAAADLNVGFLKRMRLGRPWVRVKIAASLDGRTALQNGDSQWISGEAARRDVHTWRARSAAILTGIGTVLADNPSMTARVQEPPLRPLRVVADTRWRTPPACRILQDPATCLVAGSEDIPIPPDLLASGSRCLALPAPGGKLDLQALLRELAGLEINEVQVEAGAILCGALLNADLVDEILLYQAPVLLSEGGPGLFALGLLETMQDRTHLEVLETRQFGQDLRWRLRPLRDHLAVSN